MNAFQKPFTDANQSGCYFHVCQSFVRKINKVGLKPVYTQSARLAVSLRRIPALAFFGFEKIEAASDLVVEEIIGKVECLSMDENVKEVIDLPAFYFQKSYIARDSESTCPSLSTCILESISNRWPCANE